MKISITRRTDPAERAAFIDDAGMNDATIDNDATIRGPLPGQGVHGTENKSYLQAAEKGIRYLLKIKQEWRLPAFYPDKSLYRSEITYNDKRDGECAERTGRCGTGP